MPLFIHDLMVWCLRHKRDTPIFLPIHSRAIGMDTIKDLALPKWFFIDGSGPPGRRRVKQGAADNRVWKNTRLNTKIFKNCGLISIWCFLAHFISYVSYYWILVLRIIFLKAKLTWVFVDNYQCLWVHHLETKGWKNPGHPWATLSYHLIFLHV